MIVSPLVRIPDFKFWIWGGLIFELGIPYIDWVAQCQRLNTLIQGISNPLVNAGWFPPTNFPMSFVAKTHGSIMTGTDRFKGIPTRPDCFMRNDPISSCSKFSRVQFEQVSSLSWEFLVWLRWPITHYQPPLRLKWCIETSTPNGSESRLVSYDATVHFGTRIQQCRHCSVRPYTEFPTQI